MPKSLGNEIQCLWLGTAGSIRAVKHFLHTVEGRYLAPFIDLKPLTYALHSKSDRYCPREIRPIGYISLFTTELRKIKSGSNSAADVLSRPQPNVAVCLAPEIPAVAVAHTQDNVCIQAPHSSPFRRPQVPLAKNFAMMLCGIPTCLLRPISGAEMSTARTCIGSGRTRYLFACIYSRWFDVQTSKTTIIIITSVFLDLRGACAGQDEIRTVMAL